MAHCLVPLRGDAICIGISWTTCVRAYTHIVVNHYDREHKPRACAWTLRRIVIVRLQLLFSTLRYRYLGKDREKSLPCFWTKVCTSHFSAFVCRTTAAISRGSPHPQENSRKFVTIIRVLTFTSENNKLNSTVKYVRVKMKRVFKWWREVHCAKARTVCGKRKDDKQQIMTRAVCGSERKANKQTQKIPWNQIQMEANRDGRCSFVWSKVTSTHCCFLFLYGGAVTTRRRRGNGT